ncbi:MAG: ATP-dependent Clp protease adaptor ClpS [Mesorhizobium sp.]|nr:ATP-dependent Clp protease adaptor ClpS [Mesorhizobium sp.]MBL8579602.1 ATP-dependent Clp protease adaptor ClpS [Mesorhizobium sp.]
MSGYSVLLLDDNQTPMAFVVDVIQRFFGKDRKTAEEIMLHIHKHGATVCGNFPQQEIAEAKVSEVTNFARQNQHPLQCIMLKNK